MEWLFGFIGVLIGSLVSGYKEIWLDLWVKRKNSEHLAIQIICDLDSFIDACADVVADDGLTYGQVGEDGYARAQVPAPTLVYSVEPNDLRIFSANLMYQMISLPVNVRSVNKIIAYHFEYDDPPFYGNAFEERQYQYALLGLKADGVINELKTKYNFPSDSFNSYSPIGYLKERKELIESSRQEVQSKIESSNSDL